MKLEITLYKSKEEMWKTLLKDDKIEDKADNSKDKWSKFDSLPEEEERNDEDIDSFFKKIYGNADSESKRAMIKSFVLHFYLPLLFLTFRLSPVELSLALIGTMYFF